MWSDELLDINRGLSSPVKSSDESEGIIEEPRGTYYVATDTLDLEVSDDHYCQVVNDDDESFADYFDLFSMMHHEIGHSALTKGTLAWHETFTRNAVTTLDFVNISAAVTSPIINDIDPTADPTDEVNVPEPILNMSEQFTIGSCRHFLIENLDMSVWTPIQESYAIIQEGVMIEDVDTVEYLETYLNSVIPANIPENPSLTEGDGLAIFDQTTPITQDKVDSVSWLYQAEVVSTAIDIFQSSSVADITILRCIHRLASISSDYQIKHMEWRERAPRQFLHILKFWAASSNYLFRASDASEINPQATADHLTMAAGYEVSTEDVRSDYRSERFEDILDQSAMSILNHRKARDRVLSLAQTVSGASAPFCRIIRNRETGEIQVEMYDNADSSSKWILIQHIMATKIKWMFLQSILTGENLFERPNYKQQIEKTQTAFEEYAQTQSLEISTDEIPMFFKILRTNRSLDEIRNEIISEYEEYTGWSFDSDQKFLETIGLNKAVV